MILTQRPNDYSSLLQFALQAIWESTVLPLVYADFMETNVENIAIALKNSAMQHLAALRVMVCIVIWLEHTVETLKFWKLLYLCKAGSSIMFLFVFCWYADLKKIMRRKNTMLYLYEKSYYLTNKNFQLYNKNNYKTWYNIIFLLRSYLFWCYYTSHHHSYHWWPRHFICSIRHNHVRIFFLPLT